MNPRLKIILRAVQIRLNNNEKLDNILDSYPNLSTEEKLEIKLQLENTESE